VAEHDDVLAEAVKTWCDAELLADDDYSSGTLVGEWHLTVSRSGFGAEGEPISQTFIASSQSAPTRILGLLREATMRLEHTLRGYFV
jgi:hypothetical protein